MKKSFFFTLLATVLCFAAQAQSPASYPTEFAKGSGNNVILRSPNGKYTLIYQGDGNLCLYNGTKPTWATMTNGKASTKLLFQTDGNLCLYSGANAIWATMSNGKGGSYLSLQDDGNLCIYTKDNKAIWATMTNGK